MDHLAPGWTRRCVGSGIAIGCRRGAHGRVGRGGSPVCWRRWRSSGSRSRSSRWSGRRAARPCNASEADGHADGREVVQEGRRRRSRRKPKPLTAAQKRARAKAVDAVREQGDTTLHAADYDPRSRAARADRPPGRRRDRRLLGLLLQQGRLPRQGRAATARTKVEVAKQGKATIALRYGVYKDGDKAGAAERHASACASGSTAGTDGAGHGPAPHAGRFQRSAD